MKTNQTHPPLPGPAPRDARSSRRGPCPCPSTAARGCAVPPPPGSGRCGEGWGGAGAVPRRPGWPQSCEYSEFSISGDSLAWKGARPTPKSAGRGKRASAPQPSLAHPGSCSGAGGQWGGHRDPHRRAPLQAGEPSARPAAGHPPPGQGEWGTRCPCRAGQTRSPRVCRQFWRGGVPPATPPGRTHLRVQAPGRRGVLAVLLDVEGHLLARGAGVGALRAGVAAPRVLPHDAAGGGVSCKDARGGKQGARPPAPPPAVARSAPPPRLAGATQSPGAGCGVRGVWPWVPAARCWVLWGQETPCSKPHMHRGSFPKGGAPRQGARLCPPGPSLPWLVTSPHPTEQRAEVSSLASGLG